MKELKSTDPDYQTIVEHKGKMFSIVDLCVMPLEDNGKRFEPKHKDLLERYRPFNYELALIDGDVPEVLDRFTSVENAKIFIEDNYR